MKQCVFLSAENVDYYQTDDLLVESHLHDLGWKLDIVPWNITGISWNEIDMVVVRSTWDYHTNLDAFLQRLTAIEKSSAILKNNLSDILWNSRKYYLKDLFSVKI